MPSYTFPDVGHDSKDLIDKALNQRKFSYVPYSNYAVGCSVLAEDGTVFVGSNIENASYPVGICAERSALTYAASLGHRRFKAMVVATKDGGSCCGACRQFCREFFYQDTPIIFINEKGDITWLTTMDELLPNSFGPENLFSPDALPSSKKVE